MLNPPFPSSSVSPYLLSFNLPHFPCSCNVSSCWILLLSPNLNPLDFSSIFPQSPLMFNLPHSRLNLLMWVSCLNLIIFESPQPRLNLITLNPPQSRLNLLMLHTPQSCLNLLMLNPPQSCLNLLILNPPWSFLNLITLNAPQSRLNLLMLHPPHFRSISSCWIPLSLA